MRRVRQRDREKMFITGISFFAPEAKQRKVDKTAVNKL
jgi:hypothetical protein